MERRRGPKRGREGGTDMDEVYGRRKYDSMTRTSVEGHTMANTA